MQLSSSTVQQNERIHAIDSVRGFALLGILLMNIPYFGLPVATVENLGVRNEYSGINYDTWWIMRIFFEGSMRGLFSMLFGASMLLLTARLAKKTDIDSAAEIYYRRLIWLLLFGLIDAYLVMWAGDILYVYAICGFFLFPLRRLKPKHLILVAGILMALHIAQLTYYFKAPLRLKNHVSLLKKTDSTKLNVNQKAQIAAWDAFIENQKIENIRIEAEKEILAKKGSLSDAFLFNAADTAEIQSTSYYHTGYGDIIIFMIIGMALFKLGIMSGERSKKFYLLLSIAGYAVGIPLACWYNNTLVSTHFNWIEFYTRIPVQFYEIRRLAMTFGHLGLFMLVYKLGWFRFLFRAWGKVGQMAFSNYLLQNILCGIYFYGWGFNRFNELQRFQLYYVVAAVWIINIAFSYIWLHNFRIGPFEWVWRSLTYWKPQRMKKEKLQEGLALA